MFITVEGIEGSGKTTLIAGLVTELASIGAETLVLREPGGTPVGDALRAIFVDARLRIDPLAEAFVVNASRAQLVSERIAPALKAGAIILCDRFFDATIAYQGYGRGLDIEMLIRLSLVATQSIAPDMTFLVDLDVATSQQRVRQRGGGDRIEREPAEFHERVRAGYHELARRFDRYIVLDGTHEPAELVAAALVPIVRRRLAISL